MRILRTLALLLAAPALLPAQARDLRWPDVTVTAHLDADGRLHVRERQAMVFTGDWNGGERRFDLRSGQRLELNRMRRIDPATGTFRDMAPGSLDLLDHFDWTGGSTLRWRSRLPSDPPFRDTPITYELDFTYSNVLVPQGGVDYLLNHDFAFADRPSPIDTFRVTLTLDSAWVAPDGFTGRFARSPLVRGEGYVVDLPLTYRGATPPAGVRVSASHEIQLAVILTLGIAFITLLALLIVRERALGRFAPLPAPSEITSEWLEANVFSLLPEVAGAAWDDSTAAPEVAAILARLVAERKLSSEVRSEKTWIFKRDILTLRIEVDRARFTGHERTLINALFRSNEQVTDTEKVRKRYEKSGFDPAALIRKPLEKLVDATTPGRRGAKPSRRPALALCLVGLAVMIIAGAIDVVDAPFGFMTLGVSLALYLFAALQAAFWRLRVHRLPVHALRFLLPTLAGLWYLEWVLDQGFFRVGSPMLVGVTLWVIGLMTSIFNQARSRQSAERIAIRKRLTAARHFFREQLASRQPQLRDAWFPWLIAFGLGPHIDRWFRAFGGTASSVMSTASAVSSSSGSSGGGGSWTGFGGGGGFAGAGSSAAFAAAVGGMAAAVPSPSSGGSSGGGGGGGGGGSSGGGGGGGW